MATGLTAEQLRASSPEELVSKLAEAKEELFNLRFQGATAGGAGPVRTVLLAVRDLTRN